uniref:Urocanate hydratase n=1 Tax=Anabas testudineus TaxID=64144 RepID=A0A7N6C1I4_ANATE
MNIVQSIIIKCMISLWFLNALRYFPPSHHETLAPEFAQELRQYGHIYMYRFCPTLRMRAYPIDQYPCRTRQAASLMLMIMNNLDPAVAQFPQELVTYGGNGQVFSNWAQFLLVMHYLSQMTEEQTLVMYSGHPMGLPCISVYGQMTAGSYCYIGPQGIVHGTMVDEAPLRKRHDQGWLMEVTSSMEHCIKRIREAKNSKTALSLGYHGNVVDLWERLALEYERTGELLVDLGSDQTSLHNPYNGGYYPVQLSFRQANQLMSTDSNRFCGMVQESLRRHIKAINKLSDAGMFFWDYGNAFLLEAKRAGADVDKFDIFLSLESNINLDLAVTDDIAAAVLEEIGASVSDRIRQQYNDNIRWIREAGKHKMVVGSQARILYSDQKGRVCIALAINKAIAEGRVSAPVVISRDHHDVSGTDSPFRETSNVYDGSAFCADMAVQNFVGDAFRGATWVSLHNGGGVGWGEVINGGFGLLLDGSAEAAKRANIMLNWDVSNGVARRCWSGNSNAYETIQRTMEEHRLLRVTMPFPVQDDQVLDRALQG